MAGSVDGFFGLAAIPLELGGRVFDDGRSADDCASFAEPGTSGEGVGLDFGAVGSADSVSVLRRSTSSGFDAGGALAAE